MSRKVRFASSGLPIRTVQIQDSNGLYQADLHRYGEIVNNSNIKQRNDAA